MKTTKTPAAIDHDRRRLLGTAATGIAVVGMASLPDAQMPQAAEANDAIRAFRIDVPEEALADLRRRIAATRWPERETVTDDSQGVPLAAMQEVARYWATDYDWRKVEARLNARPQSLTQIDGLDIHFIHVRSRHENALPLIVTHGWPGSVIEQLKIINLLTNPTAHGVSASDAFHLVIPSLPGFGFSGKPAATGWGPERTARAWVVLMQRLGYAKFVAQGGDLGAGVCTALATQAPPQLLGIHTNFPGTIPPDIAKALAAGNPTPSDLSVDEQRAYQQLTVLFAKRRAYAQMMATRPQTLYALADSPIRTCGLAVRSWRRLWPAGGGDHLGHGWTHGQWVSCRRPDPRRRPRRLHAVLADQHAGLRRPVLLGKSHQSLQRSGCLGSGRRERLSRRELSSAAKLDGARVSQAHLFQRGRQRRSLRGLGAA
jgi:pimeloyl-ACP methyl ester carboxylesterase